jgi:hypothetical protein
VPTVIAFGNVSGNGKGGAIELVDQVVIAFRKIIRGRRNFFRKLQRLMMTGETPVLHVGQASRLSLVDVQFFEKKGHG